MQVEYSERHHGIARANGFELYGAYAEIEAAKYLKIPVSRLRVLRKTKQIGCIVQSARSHGYFGYHLVDYFLTREICPDTQPTPDIKLASTGCPNSRAVPPGAGPGSMPKLDKRDALASAQRILMKQSSA